MGLLPGSPAAIVGRRRPALVAALVASVAVIGATPAAAATWHVRADAGSGGRGSEASPFGSLGAAEAASRPGETIVVEPAPRSVRPLDGGIALKRGQTLVGGGPRVAGIGARAPAPVITNTTTRLSGDGVRLADGTTASNLVIRDTARGGVYGLDSVGVRIAGNDVSGHNASCAPGFTVQAFTVPTGIPFVGGGLFGKGPLTPQNGWAGIMVDGSTDRGTIAIARNRVHHANCGDGIDIRAAGNSDLTARVDGNVVTRLEEGPIKGAAVGSVLAIGMQARDSARLGVRQDRNSETYIGSEDADCEGQFANTSEAGVIHEVVDHNRFRHGIGGFSCNGFEAIVSNGTGTIDLVLRNSRFEDNQGDMFEEANLGHDSTMRWRMDRVVARRTRQRGQNGPASSDPGLNPIPFNVGDCMLLGQTGGGNRTTFRMRDSVLEDCNNGVSALSGMSTTNGNGRTQELAIDIAHSRIARADRYGVQIANVTPLRRLRVKVRNTEVTRANSYGVALDRLATGTTDDAVLDLGGTGRDRGENCLTGNRKADAETSGYAVSARGNWWGRPGGPRPGQIVARGGGRVAFSGALDARPACGPRPRGRGGSALTLSGLRLSRRRFRSARRGRAVAPRRRRLGRRVGTRVRYRLSSKARVRVAVQRALKRSGRVVGAQCVKRTRRNAGRRRCTRYRTLRGTFAHRGRVGINRFRFTGRLRGRRLRPGRYRLVARARSQTGKRSRRARTRFRIVRR